MTTNDYGKLNVDEVAAIEDTSAIPPSEWSPKQADYLDAYPVALAHQSQRWYSYQDWGRWGPVEFLEMRGIEFIPVSDLEPVGQSWYDGCVCN